MLPIDDIFCDVRILGASGAGMLAALHVTTANPTARILIAANRIAVQTNCDYSVTSDGSRRSKASNPACSK
jgi:hypothetical protein